MRVREVGDGSATGGALPKGAPQVAAADPTRATITETRGPETRGPETRGPETRGLNSYSRARGLLDHSDANAPRSGGLDIETLYREHAEYVRNAVRRKF